jgi:SAM-dependent methyltransferase
LPPQQHRAHAFDTVFDAVTPLNVLYHLSDPTPAGRETHRVQRAGGHLVASAIARNDSPEVNASWTRPATSFDADDAPGLLGRVFDSVTVHPWDAPLVTLPTPAAIRDYLLGRQAAEVAAAAAREVPVPLHVTKRGALIVAKRSMVAEGTLTLGTSRHLPTSAHGRPPVP